MKEEEPFVGEEKSTETIPLATGLSVHKNEWTITGFFETEETISPFAFEFLMKKRRGSTSYHLPLAWVDQKWMVTCNILDYALDRGVWDFYLINTAENIEYRLKLQEDIIPSAAEEGLYLTEDAALHFYFYRTIKDSLSLTVETARASLTNIHFEQTADPFTLRTRAHMSDPYLVGLVRDYPCDLSFVNRQTFQSTPIPLSKEKKNEDQVVRFDIDYQQLLDFDILTSGRWDAFLQLQMDGEIYDLRLHLQDGIDDTIVEKQSLVEFQESFMYQIYFYETIKNHLSIKMHRTPIKLNIEHLSIEQDILAIQGYGYLDIQHPSKDIKMKRNMIVRRRGSNDEISLSLPEVTYDDTERSFDIQIPLQEVIELEEIEKEIFDVSLQIYHAGEWYEKRLGFDHFTYIKDDILGKAFMKNNNHYTRVYLTQTPSGNLKIETYYLTKAAYYYLKYGQNLDRKIQQNKEVWLIGERADTAQDTGYHFFKYCREHHPKLAIYYVIHAGAKDIKHIKDLGNVLYSGTLDHVRKASIASVFVGSHDLDNILPLKGLELANYVQGKRIFIQHGVLGRKNVEYHKKYYRDPFHLFFVSSTPEKKLVEKKMGYDADEVKVTGLSRFDALLEKHKERRSMLLMPTWREWLGRDDSFKQSMYFKRYTSLLRNQTLQTLLEEHDVTLDFYPHYRMQPFIDAFKKVASKRVNIIELGEKTVQELLMENKLMVTDYSSVSFDFNYMSKPIVFYHFDVQAFFKNGMLRPLADTFLGDICKEEDEVVQSIAFYIENNFAEREEIQHKKKQVFDQIDQQNNERIFHEIKKIKKR